MPTELPHLTRRAPEALLFGSATAVGLLHALDDGLLNRQPGVGPGQHVLAAALALVVGAVAIAVFPSLRPALRCAVAFLFGTLATVNGAMHVKHIADMGADTSDITGAMAAAAGVALIGLAVATPWLHRGEGTAGRRRRWAHRALVVPLGLLALFYVVVPIGIALTETHAFRERIGAPPDGAYREVTFAAADGVRLSGWYRPTRTGATILLVHGGGGDRTGAARHAEILARRGHGVLLYDARGRGRSEGTQNAWGWGWEQDVSGALAFLKARNEVDPERIGALGLSTGADVLVQFAGRRDDLSAVVADGAVAGSFEDGRRVDGITAFTPFMALEFATVRVLSGSRPGPPLEDMVERISSPLLLVAAGPPEKAYGEAYDRAAGDGPVELWYLPEVGHTAAVREVPAEYERRVTSFLEEALS
jgi:poly(3-hydroxybutyrate) depolymerase